MLQKLNAGLLILFTALTPLGAVADPGYSFEAESYTTRDLETLLKHEYAPTRNVGQIFKEAQPQIDKLNLIRKNILPLLETYAESELSDRGFTLNNIKMYEQIFEWPPRNNMHRSIMYQVTSSDEPRFQVDGTNPDRLAIFDNQNISFNIRGLNERKPDFVGLLQLFLHELSHIDSKTSLEVRDAWVARVTNWVRSHTTTLELGPDKITTITLPRKNPPPQLEVSRYNETTSDTITRELQKSFLIIKENSGRAQLYSEVYAGFKSFEDTLRASSELWSAMPDHREILWPHMEVTSVSKTPDQKLQIEYRQTPRLYKPIYTPGNTRTYSSTESSLYSYGTPIEPQWQVTQYRIEIDPVHEQSETQRLYTKSLSGGDFEIQRIQVVKERRFLSLRVRWPEGQTWNKEMPLHLIAKDLENKSLLSFPLLTSRVLNSGEVLLHFEVGNRDLNLSHLLVPQVDKSGFYSELQIRPSRPAQLQGLIAAETSSLEVRRFTVGERALDKDKIGAELDLKATKKVTGLTLDLQYYLISRRVNLNGFFGDGSPHFSEAQDLPWIGSGRKHYFSLDKLSVREVNGETEIKFSFPQDTIQQTVSPRKVGPVTTIWDSKKRDVQNVWVHFSDGTIEKVPQKSLPATINIQSGEERKRVWQEIQKKAGSYSEGFEGPAVPRCESVFGN